MPRSLKERVHDIIYQHDSFGERLFNVVLIIAILSSVVVVALDSVAGISSRHAHALRIGEWFFTILFTVEYVLRIWSSPRPLDYVTSFYGVVDLAAIVPTYLGVVFPPGRFLVALRVLRIVRVFRILKLSEYVAEASVLAQALRASRQKIVVFITTVLSVVVVVGALMYTIEGGENGFTSIPQSIYWAIVTMTTVGYGDVSPHTTLGKVLASALMLAGYGIIAVPTGIVTLELQRAANTLGRRVCPGCGARQHDADASYCKYCGTHL